jgi:hypothetical protein
LTARSFASDKLRGNIVTERVCGSKKWQHGLSVLWELEKQMNDLASGEFRRA